LKKSHLTLLLAAAFRFDVQKYASAKSFAAPRICNFLNSLERMLKSLLLRRFWKNRN